MAEFIFSGKRAALPWDAGSNCK